MTIQIIIEVLLCILFIAAMTAYFFLRNSEEKSAKVVLGKLNDGKVLLIIAVVLAVSLGIWFYDVLFVKLALEKCYLNSIVFVLVFTMGFIDLKEHIIPNELVLTGFGIWLIAALLEIILGETPVKKVLQFSFLGFFVCGGVLLVLAAIMKKGLGMGDVKMFAMLGLLYGMSNTYSILLLTVIPMAVFSIIQLARKKVTRKSTLPMAPFTVFAFLVGIVSGM